MALRQHVRGVSRTRAHPRVGVHGSPIRTSAARSQKAGARKARSLGANARPPPAPFGTLGAGATPSKARFVAAFFARTREPMTSLRSPPQTTQAAQAAQAAQPAQPAPPAPCTGGCRRSPRANARSLVHTSPLLGSPGSNSSSSTTPTAGGSSSPKSSGGGGGGGLDPPAELPVPVPVPVPPSLRRQETGSTQMPHTWLVMF
jgi:hypothetical protein